MKIETEIKIKIDDLKKFQVKFNEFGGKKSSWAFERTYGFFTPNRTNIEEGIFPRVKVVDGLATMGVKVKTGNGKYFERKEYETKCEEKSGIEMMKVFGYTEVIIFEKLRQKWVFDNVEVCLDRLPFGNYIEIEGEKKNIEKMVKLLKLEKSQRITVAYLVLFDEWKKINNSIAKDAIFGGI